MAWQKKETTKQAATAKKVIGERELSVMHFQTPEMLCDWVNQNAIDVFSIVPYDRFQAVYYFK